MANASLADHKFYVYVHKRLLNGQPFYVGKGHGDRAHKMSCRGAHWNAIVKKDGGRDVDILIKGIDEEFSFLIEMEVIDKYRTLGIKLANKTDGGEGVSGYKHTKPAHNKGVPCSEEMKARISETLKAKGCLPPVGWNRGLKQPQELIEKRRQALLKRWSVNKKKSPSEEAKAKMRAAKLGKKLSEETRKKLSESLKSNKYKRTTPDMRGFTHSEESRKKMSESMKGRAGSRCKEVRRVDTGEIFKSCKDAAKSIGKNTHSLVAACCRGNVNTAYGHRFEFINV